MKHKTIQDLIDKFTAIEKRATQIDIAEMIEAICGDNSPDEYKLNYISVLAESLKKGV